MWGSLFSHSCRLITQLPLHGRGGTLTTAPTDDWTGGENASPLPKTRTAGRRRNIPAPSPSIFMSIDRRRQSADLSPRATQLEREEARSEMKWEVGGMRRGPNWMNPGGPHARVRSCHACPAAKTVQLADGVITGGGGDGASLAELVSWKTLFSAG